MGVPELALLLADVIDPSTGVSLGVVIAAVSAATTLAVVRARQGDAITGLDKKVNGHADKLAEIDDRVDRIETRQAIEDGVAAKLRGQPSSESTTGGTMPYRKASR